MTKSEVDQSNWSNGSLSTCVNRRSMTIPVSWSPAVVSSFILDCVMFIISVVVWNVKWGSSLAGATGGPAHREFASDLEGL